MMRFSSSAPCSKPHRAITVRSLHGLVRTAALPAIFSAVSTVSLAILFTACTSPHSGASSRSSVASSRPLSVLMRTGSVETWSRATAASLSAPLRLRLRHGNVVVQALYPVVGGEGTTDRVTRLTVTVNGRVAIDKRVDNAPTGLAILTLEQEQAGALLDTFSGGAHCCFSSTLAVVTPRGDGIVASKDWGNAGYSLMKANDGSSYVFRTGDDRLAYAFSSFAGSTFPIVVWSFRAGSFADVSREYRGALTNDAARHWHEYLNDAKGNTAPHAALVAYLADEYRIGAGPAAWKKVVTATSGEEQFHAQARAWLRDAGYLRGSALGTSAPVVSPQPASAVDRHDICRHSS